MHLTKTNYVRINAFRIAARIYCTESVGKVGLLFMDQTCRWMLWHLQYTIAMVSISICTLKDTLVLHIPHFQVNKLVDDNAFGENILSGLGIVLYNEVLFVEILYRVLWVS